MDRASKKKTIMVVEDDPFIAMDLEDAFQANGYDVMGPFANVKSGMEGLMKTEPNLATLDYNLGNETSVPIARELEMRHIPYFFISTQMDHTIFENGLLTRPVISKPFVPDQLINIVEALT